MRIALFVHDVNNLLGVILTYCALHAGDGQGPSAADFAEIQVAAEQAVDLTKQLLAQPLRAGSAA